MKKDQNKFKLNYYVKLLLCYIIMCRIKKKVSRGQIKMNK